MAGGDRALPRARSADAIAALSAFHKNGRCGELDLSHSANQDKSKDLKDAIERAEQQQLDAFFMSQQHGRTTRSWLCSIRKYPVATSNLLKTAPTSATDSRQGFLLRRFDQRTVQDE